MSWLTGSANQRRLCPSIWPSCGWPGWCGPGGRGPRCSIGWRTSTWPGWSATLCTTPSTPAPKFRPITWTTKVTPMSDAHPAGHGHGSGGDHDHQHPLGLKGFVLSLFGTHSHDAADSVDSALEASTEGIRAVKISLVALGVTAIVQLVVVLITGSVALLADTIHNFSDALTAIPLWVAFVLSRRAANRRYTYGYGRAEDLAGVFIVAMIALSSILAAYESIRRLIDPQPLTHAWVVLAAGLIGFAGNELVAVYRIRVGNKIGSAALV